MKTVLTALVISGTLILGAAPAAADWDPNGEPATNHKMHYPQYPDPSGWDVDFTFNDYYEIDLYLADDRQPRLA